MGKANPADRMEKSYSRGMQPWNSYHTFHLRRHWLSLEGSTSTAEVNILVLCSQLGVLWLMETLSGRELGFKG